MQPKKKRRYMRKVTAVHKWKKRSDETTKDTHIPLLENNKFDYIFLGDSMFERFGYDTNAKALWNKSLAEFNIANLSIGGDSIENILFRIEFLEVFKYIDQAPKKIILLAGTNDLDGTDIKVMVDGMTKIISDIKLAFPTTKLYLLGVFPRLSSKYPNDEKREKDIYEKLIDYNSQISHLPGVDNYRYFGDRFLDERNRIKKDENLIDCVHLIRKEYKIFGEELLSILKE